MCVGVGARARVCLCVCARARTKERERRELDDRRFENLDPKGCPPPGRKSRPFVSRRVSGAERIDVTSFNYMDV